MKNLFQEKHLEILPRELLDENVPLLEVNGESNGIFAKLMKIFKKN